MPRLLQKLSSPWAIGLLGTVGCTIVAQIIFGGFFPGPNGMMGHDFAGGLPGMLAEYYWAVSNGTWSTPWFTPAFCGGIPLYADPGSTYYAFPGLFVRGIGLDPVLSSHLTFLLFVAVGFSGAFFFMNRSLGTSVAAALVGATIFGLNGFFSQRFIIGHFGFHGVMLVPWLALAVTATSAFDRRRWVAEACRAVLGGLVLAYWVHSGASSLLVAFGLATVALVLLQWAKGGVVFASLVRSTGAILVGAALSASKLIAASSYLSNFPRSDYLLPGMGSIFQSAQLAFTTLFLNWSDIAGFAGSRWQNLQWSLDRHELEYGVTVVPLLLVMFAAGSFLEQKDLTIRWPIKRVVFSVLLAILILSILAINTYSPQWNAFLKTLPVIGSSSSLVRWFVIFVPLVAIGGAMALDSITLQARGRMMLAAAAVGLVVIQTMSVDRAFYESQSYDPKPVLEAFKQARNSPGFMPSIQAIGAFVDDKGNVVMPLNRNDFITQGVSQLACYIPIFGYRLESFPLKTLRPGPVSGVIDGVFNVKNPACFVFPKENSCNIGDHFTVAQRESAEKFVNYRAFPFEKSRAQKMADIITKLALVLSALVLLGGLVVWLRNSGRSAVVA